MSLSVLFVDGWYGPDQGDWQQLWSRELPGSARVAQADWERPDRDAWVARLDAAIAACPEPPVLVGHSLGALTVLHWAAGRPGRAVRAALLVTPADVERRDEPALRGFAPIPVAWLPFPALVVSSDDDWWMTPERARHFAERWGAGYAEAGAVGHLTVADGPGAWPHGLELLRTLAPDALLTPGLRAG